MIVFSQTTLSDELRESIEADLEKYAPQIQKTLNDKKDRVDREVLFRFRTYWRSIIDQIDPFYDGGLSLARYWYRAADSGFEKEEFQTYVEILSSLSRFGKARVAGREMCYSVIDVPETFLDDVRRITDEADKLRKGKIGKTEYRWLSSSARLLIEAIDLEYTGAEPDEPISVAEQWEAAKPWGEREFRECDDEDYATSFESVRTILWTILAHGKAKVRRRM